MQIRICVSTTQVLTISFSERMELLCSTTSLSSSFALSSALFVPPSISVRDFGFLTFLFREDFFLLLLICCGTRIFMINSWIFRCQGQGDSWFCVVPRNPRRYFIQSSPLFSIIPLHWIIYLGTRKLWRLFV